MEVAYRPEAWHDLFVVAAGSSALTGLLFVAVSIHLEGIAHNPAFRYRALQAEEEGRMSAFISPEIEITARQPA